MSCKPYHPHRPPNGSWDRGGGRETVFLTTFTGYRLPLNTFNEQYAAAQLNQAQLFLGAKRKEAEAFTAQRILEIRDAKKWISRANQPFKC